MKPMIFFDVDGTLMDNHDYQVTPSTKKALQKLQENGYKIGIATGRAVNSLKRTGVVILLMGSALFVIMVKLCLIKIFKSSKNWLFPRK